MDFGSKSDGQNVPTEGGRVESQDARGEDLEGAAGRAETPRKMSDAEQYRGESCRAIR